MNMYMIVLPNGDLDLIARDHHTTYLRLSFRQDYHSFWRTVKALYYTGKYTFTKEENNRMVDVINGMIKSNPQRTPEDNFNLSEDMIRALEDK